MDKNPEGIGKVKVNIASETVTAVDFKLNTYYELGAAIDFEKAFGQVLENELVKVLGNEIRFEIDHVGLDQIVRSAESDGATSPGTYSATPSTSQEWVWKKYQILDYIEAAAVNIQRETLRTEYFVQDRVCCLKPHIRVI